ncbi:MAG: hypothetical protein IKL73_01445 [Lachnospiraceae bacterium]|nr:hypothetical protein [Lachnospiraceae bacterium]
MPKCYNCGAEIEEGKIYCDNCNDSVENETYLDDLLNEIVGRENAEEIDGDNAEDINPFADMFSNVEGTTWDENNNNSEQLFDIEPIEDNIKVPQPEDIVIVEEEPEDDFLSAFLADVESTFADEESIEETEAVVEDLVENVQEQVEEPIEEQIQEVAIEEPKEEMAEFSLEDFINNTVEETQAEEFPDIYVDNKVELSEESKDEVDIAALLDDDEPFVPEVKLAKEKKVKEKKVKEKKVKEPKSKKEKKPFLTTLGDIFFESEEELEAAKAKESKIATKEQEAFIRTMEENPDEENDNKKKKGKKEKSKKEKKAKKEKKQKVKKERKEPEPDELIQITPIKTVLFVVTIASVVLFVVVWTYAFGYYNNVKDAKKYYKEGNYTMAYETLSGMELREDEQRLYTELRLLMGLEKNLNSYYNFKSMNMNLEALDSLFKGVKNYQDNVENSKKLDVYEDYNELYEKTLKILKDNYKIAQEDAIYYSNITIPEQYMQILKNYGGNDNDSND